MLLKDKPHLGDKIADRGWWVSVEFNRTARGRKGFDEALNLLERAAEHYDMIIHDGKTVCRGIFTKEDNMGELGRLIGMVKGWSDSVIHWNGLKLDGVGPGNLKKALECSVSNAPCRSKESRNARAFLGCHLSRIGLLNFSVSSLIRGKSYWFSFMKDDSGGRIRLDRERLRESVFEYEFCPIFPQDTLELLDRLPHEVDLDRRGDRDIWTVPKKRVRSQWLSRFPPIIPRYDRRYELWMIRLIEQRTRNKSFT